MDVLYIYIYTSFIFLKLKPDKIAISLKLVVTVHSESLVETSECVRLLKPAQRGGWSMN